jgi:hypothetical protein
VPREGQVKGADPRRAFLAELYDEVRLATDMKLDLPLPDSDGLAYVNPLGGSYETPEAGVPQVDGGLFDPLA